MGEAEDLLSSLLVLSPSLRAEEPRLSTTRASLVTATLLVFKGGLGKKHQTIQAPVLQLPFFFVRSQVLRATLGAVLEDAGNPTLDIDIDLSVICHKASREFYTAFGCQCVQPVRPGRKARFTGTKPRMSASYQTRLCMLFAEQANHQVRHCKQRDPEIDSLGAFIYVGERRLRESPNRARSVRISKTNVR